ncbi:hypothetical protein nbrc107697_33690 [Gordonia crocea]|uniref:Uncharacterized protein n=1 Tax=Gordonia crocea TaxID=589162 RepID=A0A7I9V2S3_9ACTN|nr:hypothetical protein nbrc107697_33690 [Gordonia crocea]
MRTASHARAKKASTHDCFCSPAFAEWALDSADWAPISADWALISVDWALISVGWALISVDWALISVDWALDYIEWAPDIHRPPIGLLVRWIVTSMRSRSTA